MRALAKLIGVMEAGKLVEAARWVTFTRTIFIEKKTGPAPRTLKVGEVLRSTTAKRLLQANAPKLRPKLVRMRQWGISLPGGCESLIHWRTTVEQAARDGVMEPVVVADLDMQNYFNTVEWPSIRASLRLHFEEAVPTVEWEQQQHGVSLMPDGSSFTFDRGAEQGEPLGPIKAALPLGDAREKLYERVALQRACDEWFIDDGQLVCPPALFDSWLRAFDAEIAKFGATRGRGDDVKSVARLVCPPHRVTEFDGWASEYVRSTCKIAAPNSATCVLGAIIGSPPEICAAALERCQKIREKRAAIESMGHSPSELILTRRCGDASNFIYWMRCYGDLIGQEPAARFDHDMRASVESTLGGTLPDTA
jgi:hypothetical protein